MQLDLFEDKIDRAIRRLKDNEPEDEPYYGATSGGKDSIVIMKLAEIAGVNVEWFFSVSTVDPPELIRFLKNHHPDVKFNIPKINMWNLIVKKRMPPTRLVRYCCEYFKENGGNGRVVITGVRRSESSKRANRKAVHECWKKTGKIFVNPIVDWTTNDVWSFIREYKLPYCSLYDEGFKRLGCIGCPMGDKNSMGKEFNRWPHIKKLYIRSFDKMIKKRVEDGLPTEWKSGKEVFDWWINNPGKSKDDHQIQMFD